MAFGHAADLATIGEEQSAVPAGFTRAISAAMATTADFARIADEASGKVMKLTPESAELLKRYDVMRSDGAVIGMAVEKKGRIVAPLRFEEPGVQLATLSSLATTVATQQQLVAIEKKLDDIKTDLEYLIDSQHAEVEARMTSALHVLDDVYAEMTERGRFDDDQWQRIVPLEQVIRELHARCLVHLRGIDHAMEQPSGNVGERVRVLNKAVRDAHLEVWLPMYFHAERALTQWEILWVLRQIETQPERASALSSEVAAAVAKRHWDMAEFADGIAAFLETNAGGGSRFDAVRLISRNRLRKLILDLDSVQREFRDSLTSLGLKAAEPAELQPDAWDELATRMRTLPAAAFSTTGGALTRGVDASRSRLQSVLSRGSDAPDP
ncbi:MAG: hypothetical protein RIB98_14925 [Acidimicrobiales bacterium]